MGCACCNTPPLCVCCYSVVQLIDSGATKQQGVVKKISHDYGFLQSLSCPGTVYFNTAHVVQTREGERLRVGSQVSLWFCFSLSLDVTHVVEWWCWSVTLTFSLLPAVFAQHSQSCLPSLFNVLLKQKEACRQSQLVCRECWVCCFVPTIGRVLGGAGSHQRQEGELSSVRGEDTPSGNPDARGRDAQEAKRDG